MYRFVCQTKIGEKISTTIIEEFENKDLEFNTFEEALSYYCEYFDERELMSWCPTYNEDKSKYRIIIKQVDKK